jgi:hypothetical protein
MNEQSAQNKEIGKMNSILRAKRNEKLEPRKISRQDRSEANRFWV